MIIQCENCSRKFVVKNEDIPEKGRSVQCGYCSETWHQMPTLITTKLFKTKNINKSKNKSKKNLEGLSVDEIMASDGKTYKFLGTQWAELMPSGKTGLFAKKKIGKELDKITGREIEKKSEKKTNKELDPSSQNISNRKNLPDVYETREGIGLFGYIFLLIVIGFSLVGALKTFESDLITRYPEIEYLFEILDEQLVYLSETVKNIITIINDLINSY